MFGIKKFLVFTHKKKLKKNILKIKIGKHEINFGRSHFRHEEKYFDAKQKNLSSQQQIFAVDFITKRSLSLYKFALHVAF